MCVEIRNNSGCHPFPAEIKTKGWRDCPHSFPPLFIIPDCGDKVNSGTGLLCRPVNHVAWRAGTTTQCQSQPYPSGRDFEFCY
jgi:hypothetical protein